MNYRNQLFEKNTALIGATFGSLLIGICAIPQTSVAQSFPNNNRIDEGFPSNAQNAPPFPVQQSYPIARIEPMNGMVNVRLTNQTGDPITYQVIGDTKPRILYSQSEIVLRQLQAPLTITFERPEGGLLRVEPQVWQRGMLDVNLNQTTDLGLDKKALMVEKGGLIFVN